ncbi:MAG TPA: DUF6748 domain-containing protein [Kofleriaceae bacterium]|nr:DUF6748 domain-containing protein [Kofleriaceae bacterium]
MKNLALAALPLFSLTLMSCASTGVEDELAGETAGDEALDGKADGAVDGSYTYFEISADFRKCAFPMCGGFFLDRLNRSTTVCADGHAAEACYAPELDLSESGLSAAAYDKLVEAANRSAAMPGVHAIVRGRFARTNSTPMPELGRFVVTEVWVSQSAAPSDGVFARIIDSGIRCISAPCTTILEKGLNTSRSALIADVDYEPAQLEDSVLEQVIGDLSEPHGAIIAGDRYHFTTNGQDAKGRTATAVFRRLMETADAPCFVGGCSGQICSDQEGVISTCEWRDEYACYQTATCERQADGQCGWTETPELQACLGN